MKDTISNFRFLGIVLVGLVLLLMQGVGCAKEEVTTPEEPKPIEVFKWRLQSQTSPGVVTFSQALPQFADRVREMSGGRLDISLYSAGELASVADYIDVLNTGVVELVNTGGCIYTGTVPAANLSINNLPVLLWRSTEDARQLYFYHGLDELMREGWAEHNILLLSTMIESPAGFWSTEPAYSVEDLEGFKIRIYPQIARTLERLGATPVFIPHEETYTALAMGTIDGSGTSLTFYSGAKFYEICPYIYPALVTPCGVEIMVGMDAWNSLPDDLKAILMVASRALADDCGSFNAMEMDRMRAHFDEWGTIEIEWSDEDVERIRQAALEDLDEIAGIGPICAEGVKIVKDFMKLKGYL